MDNHDFKKGNQKMRSSTIRKHPHNNQLKDYYLKYRNIITLLIKNAKKSYYKTELQTAENNSKLKWKLIGDEIGIKIKNNKHPKLIANSFNEYYINVASQ